MCSRIGSRESEGVTGVRCRNSHRLLRGIQQVTWTDGLYCHWSLQKCRLARFRLVPRLRRPLVTSTLKVEKLIDRLSAGRHSDLL